jgi:TolB-like protein
LTLSARIATFIGAMSSAGETDPPHPRPSVFLSYASEDRQAATSLRDAMDAAGIEVWYDENELGGGDAWDKKIRRQIRECDYFMAVISAQTEARHEGYFRREWRLAVERTLDMADDHTFLLPVVIDGTDQATARVPERFLAVQWVKVPNGLPNPALTALCSRLLSGAPAATPAPKRPSARAAVGLPPIAAPEMPEFPREEPGQPVRFWFHVLGWLAKSARVAFRRLPRWIRLLISLWLVLTLLSKGCSRESREPSRVSPETAQKLKSIAQKYQGSSNKEDIANLGIEIAREVSSELGDNAKATSAILAVPFADTTDNPADAKTADSTFALIYGRISMAHQGQVALSKEPLASGRIQDAVDRGKENHSSYVLYGGIEGAPGPATLSVQVARVSDGSLVWAKKYPLAGADPAAIASEVESKVPTPSDE